jgi:hypothetical protein
MSSLRSIVFLIIGSVKSDSQVATTLREILLENPVPLWVLLSLLRISASVRNDVEGAYPRGVRRRDHERDRLQHADRA